nr:hypothetical protein [Tanacetum cinerariifolium]
MRIQNDPSFFLTNRVGAPQGEELGLIKPLSDSFLAVLTNLSFQKAPVDKVPVLRVQHQAPVNKVPVLRVQHQ